MRQLDVDAKLAGGKARSSRAVRALFALLCPRLQQQLLGAGILKGSLIAQLALKARNSPAFVGMAGFDAVLPQLHRRLPIANRELT
jgi:hypothetical protein